MALRGNLSKSFLRSKELISFSEIYYDKEGSYVFEKGILKEALKRDNNGNLIRNKVNIANILNKYGVLYRMIFNAMNMEQYTYNEVQKALDHLSNYISDLGVSGIVEFHASDKTQNSDHIHFWINTEDKLIYNRIAEEIVLMGYSNKEDVYIQKYEENKKLDEAEYVKSKDESLNDRFSLKEIKNDMLLIDNINDKKINSINEKYNSIIKNINNLFFEKNYNIERYNFDIKKSIKIDFFKKSAIVQNCTLPKTQEITSIISEIERF